MSLIRVSDEEKQEEQRQKTESEAWKAYFAADYATAPRLCRPLIDQNSDECQALLGQAYENGDGVREDCEKAVFWYRKAAGLGSSYAQDSLGSLYERGEKCVRRDYTTAAMWYRKAAMQELGQAQFRLATMYEEGRGVLQSYVHAYKWYNLAASRYLSKQTLEKTISGRDRVAANMTTAQIVQAQEMAQRYKASSFRQCNDLETIGVVSVPARNAPAILIPVKKQGGTFSVPVLINNTLTLDFLIDSGASDVSVPEDVVATLMRAGTIAQSDFLGKKTYVLADGSKVPSQTFRIRSLKVGDKVVENVAGSVASVKGSLLLGQSFLGRFKTWSIDNHRHVLVLE